MVHWGGIIQGGPFRWAVTACLRASFVMLSMWMILYFASLGSVAFLGPACTKRGRILTYVVPELAYLPRIQIRVFPDLWMPA